MQDILEDTGRSMPSRAGAWPNLFVAGAPKSGTRSLLSALGAHADIYVPRQDQPRFFIGLDFDARWARFFNVIQREDDYLALFRGQEDVRYRCDGSPEYLFHADALERIRAVEPDAKAIVVLRDPVDRAYSHYLNDVRAGTESRTFGQAIREQLSGADPQPWPSCYVRYGHYGQALQDAKATFGENLHVIFFEELTTDPAGVLDQVIAFLKLDRGLPNPAELPHLNESTVPRGELTRKLLGNPSLRRLARAIFPPRARPALRSALVSARRLPPMDDETNTLLAREYEAEPDAIAQLFGRRPAWRNLRAPELSHSLRLDEDE